MNLVQDGLLVSSWYYTTTITVNLWHICTEIIPNITSIIRRTKQSPFFNTKNLLWFCLLQNTGTFWGHSVSYIIKHHVVFGQLLGIFLDITVLLEFFGSLVDQLMFPICPEGHVRRSNLNFSGCFQLWNCNLKIKVTSVQFHCFSLFCSFISVEKILKCQIPATFIGLIGH